MSVESSPHISTPEDSPTIPVQANANGKVVHEVCCGEPEPDISAVAQVPKVIKIVDEEIINIGHTEVKFGVLPKRSPADEVTKKEQRPFRAWERLLKAELKGTLPLQSWQDPQSIEVFQLGKDKYAAETAPQRIDFITPEPHKPMARTAEATEKPSVLYFEASSIEITRNVNGLRNASTITSMNPHHTNDRPDSYRSFSDAGLTLSELQEREDRQKQAKKQQN